SSGGAATSASSSASSAPAPAVNTCGSALTITAERLPGAQDASYALLTFTNTGASACNLGGYPSATLLDDKKASMTAPLTRTADTVSTISLDPQASASTLLKDSSVSCQAQTRSTYVRVSAPASSKNVDLSLALAPCALSARPLVAGTNPQP
ncbi:MAG: DUF4232 domain-containing protein, partial [Actinobacteria bacterium]|nr:DUF4232 domain-containing protein [Actinomycetota bacterium]